MSDYSLGKIYKITAKNADEGDVYIGSTICKLSKRFGHHNDNYKSRRTYTSRIIFDKYGFDNCYIELIKDFPSETKQQLWDEEAKYIKETNCVNWFIPNRTKKQYVLDTKDKKIQYDKERRKIKYECVSCNKTLSIAHKSEHEKTKNHISTLVKLSNECLSIKSASLSALNS